MSKQSSDESAFSIIKRECSGGCGAVLDYQIAIASAPYIPDMHCLNGHSYYRGGNLCIDCETAVGDALTRRRKHTERAGHDTAGESPERPRGRR
jgi:hypothetical protein